MNMSAAKRRVCSGAAKILDNDSENEWLTEGLSEDDRARMLKAFEDLVTELRRRGDAR